MITEEEFNVFQSQLVDLGQQNFKLKEELDILTEKNAELPKLKAELAELESSRESAKERHAQAMEVLREELSGLQKRATEQAEENAKRTTERLTQLKRSIQETNQEIKSKEEQVEDLQHQLRSFEVRIQQKNLKAERLEAKEKTYEPFIEFLHGARAFPMYIEDLEAHLIQINSVIHAREQELAELDERVASLRSQNDTLEKQILEKDGETQASRVALDDLKSRVKNSHTQIEKTKLAREELAKKLIEARDAAQKTVEERESELARLASKRVELEAMIEEKTQEKDHLQQELDQMQADTDAQVSTHAVKVQELRKKLSVIKETGEGEEIPRVDRDLQFQINHIIQEKKQLADNTQMLQQAIELVEEEMDDNDRAIQALTLRAAPTPRILAQPEFQEKQLLLEELVLQNKGLRNTLSDIKAKIARLKAEKHST